MRMRRIAATGLIMATLLGNLVGTPAAAEANTDWLALADQAASESATALPFVEDAGQNLYVWWISPVAWYAGKTWGWQDARATYWLSRVYARQTPSGGYGIGEPWDHNNDGSVNPATTAYTITTAWHVGRTLIDGFDDGAIPRQRVLNAVTSLLNTSTTAGGRCIDYSNASGDRGKPCVWNINATAAWFLKKAYDRGIVPAGRATEQNTKWRAFRDYTWTGFNATRGAWPYQQGLTAIQDPWHNAATVGPLYELDRVTGLKGLNGQFAIWPNSTGANADLVIYDCARVTPNLLNSARAHAFPAYTTQRQRLQSRSRWAYMALRVHNVCFTDSERPHPGRLDDVGVFTDGDRSWRFTGGAAPIADWGEPGDVPVAGDWNGDGWDEVGVFRVSTRTWYLRGVPSISPYGEPGDQAVAADRNGDGRDEVGVFRASTKTWYFRGQAAITNYGEVGDIPVTGDWNGDGIDDVGVFRPSARTWFFRGYGNLTNWGEVGDQPVVGDWNKDGIDDPGLFRPSTGTWYFRGVRPEISGFGIQGDRAVAGNWS